MARGSSSSSEESLQLFELVETSLFFLLIWAWHSLKGYYLLLGSIQSICVLKHWLERDPAKSLSYFFTFWLFWTLIWTIFYLIGVLTWDQLSEDGSLSSWSIPLLLLDASFTTNFWVWLLFLWFAPIFLQDLEGEGSPQEFWKFLECVAVFAGILAWFEVNFEPTTAELWTGIQTTRETEPGSWLSYLGTWAWLLVKDFVRWILLLQSGSLLQGWLARKGEKVLEIWGILWCVCLLAWSCAWFFGWVSLDFSEESDPALETLARWSIPMLLLLHSFGTSVLICLAFLCGVAVRNTGVTLVKGEDSERRKILNLMACLAIFVAVQDIFATRRMYN